MAGPFHSLSKPLQPSGSTTDVPCNDIDSLDVDLALLTNKTLALSDGYGPDAGGDLTWMLPKVIPLTRTGAKPYVALGLEFKLLGHSKGRNWITLVIEGACGTRGELRLGFPLVAQWAGAKGWQLHVVTPHPGVVSPPDSVDAPVVELADEPDEGSAKRKRDDIFRKMFS